MSWDLKDPHEGMSSPGPEVLLCLPLHDRRVDIDTVMFIIQAMAVSGGAMVLHTLIGHSNIRAARNKIAHYFKTKTQCKTLFFLDSDIAASLQDFAYLMEGEEQIVICPYAKKGMGSPPTAFGMGFCRIDRSVFEALDAWQTPEGEEALNRYYDDGEVVTDYFYDGASSDARWFGEDTGFWHWCAMKGFTMRQETRTTLGHVGAFVYRYPDQLAPGVVPWVHPREMLEENRSDESVENPLTDPPI